MLQITSYTSAYLSFRCHGFVVFVGLCCMVSTAAMQCEIGHSNVDGYIDLPLAFSDRYTSRQSIRSLGSLQVYLDSDECRIPGNIYCLYRVCYDNYL